MQISREYMDRLMAEAMRVREALVKTQGDDREIYSYTEDPDISEHDKELQASLDYDMEHPDDTLRHARERYEALKVSERSPYSGSLGSSGGTLMRLERALSDEGIVELKAEYDRYLKLQEEALAKGFVRYGNCRNVASFSGTAS